MTNEIEPALSAEEWASLRLVPLSCDNIVIHNDGDGLEFVVLGATGGGRAFPDVVGKYKIDSWDADGIAGVIAIANSCLPDSDPRKITREWVQSLRAAYLEFGQTNERTDKVLAIANALASYLPPESA